MKPKHRNPLPPPTLVEQRDAKLAEMRAEDGITYLASEVAFVLLYTASITAVGTINTWGQHVADLIIRFI